MRNPFSIRSEMGIRKRVFSLLLVIFVPLFLLQIFTFYNWYKHANEEELQSNLELARTAAKTFEAFVNDVLSTQRAIGLAATSSPPLSDASLLRIMRAVEEKNPMLRSFTWISPEGIHLVTTHPKIADQRVRNWEEFSRATSGVNWAISPVYVSPWAKDRVFTISQPVRDAEGKLLGLVACTAVADKLDSLIAVQRTKGAGLSLIDNRGVLVYRYPFREYAPEQREWIHFYPGLQGALKGKEVPFKTADSKGEDRVGVFVPIPSIGWVVSAGRAESEVMAAITQTLLPQAVLWLIMTAFALGAAVLLYRPLVASILKLKSHAAALGRGELSRVPLEECPAELKNLADTMNQMEEKIQLREEALRQGRQDLDRAQEVGLIGSWRLDVRRNLLSWSDENHRIFGVPKGNPLTYETFLGTVHPDDRRFVDTKWQAGLRGEPYDIEHRIMVDRQVKWVREKAYLEFDEAGELLGGFGITQDITDRKRAEEALRESELFLKETQSIARVGGWKANPDTDFLQWTEGVYQIMEAPLDYKPGVAEGLKYFLPRYIPILREKLRHCLETGDPFELECEVVTVKGNRLWTEVRGLTHRLEGKASHVIGTFQDITGRKRAEEALKKAHDELESRVKDRTEELAKSQLRLQFLASQLLLAQEKERKRVAMELHDGLMSELAATKYFLEGKLVLLDKGKPVDSGDLRRIADILAGAIKEARRLMNNLHPSILDELGLIAAIHWLSGEYQRSYPHIAVQKEFRVSEEDISGSIKAAIFRVLQEALNNFARHGKGDRVELTLSKSDGVFAISIRDNGRGFDVAHAQKGLGLESMRERVELSGGDFQIESVIGQGTTIRAIWGRS